MAFRANPHQTIEIAEGVETIGDYAFDNSYIIEITGDRFKNKTKNIKIPNSVTKIGKCAFYRCNYLENVTFGSNLTTIGDSAFSQTSVYELDLPDQCRICWLGSICRMQKTNKVTLA